MPLVLTQSDFRANLTKYLDQVNDDEIVYIVRSNSRLVAFLSQDKLYWLDEESSPIKRRLFRVRDRSWSTNSKIWVTRRFNCRINWWLLETI